MIVTSFDVGIRHLAFCIIDDETILSWENLDLKDFPTENMITILSKYPAIWDSDVILIEQQPRLNPKMKAFSTELKMFLTIRKYDYNKKCKIMYYPSKYKLEVYDGDDLPEFNNIKQLQRKNKEKCRFIMSKIIYKQSIDIIIFYLSNLKSRKDDLGDSYLQGVSYIRRQKKNKKEVYMRRPSSKQLKYKKFSKSNLKYILIEDFIRKDKTLDDFLIEYNTPIKKLYGIDYDKNEIIIELYK